MENLNAMSIRPHCQLVLFHDLSPVGNAMQDIVQFQSSDVNLDVNQVAGSHECP